MPRFAVMIFNGMQARGHTIEMWTARSLAYDIPVPLRFKKWLGYVDQFIFFPIQIRWRLRELPIDTLFVFSDQALGPWVSLVSKRPHVIHVHDFMALRSAIGEFQQNPTSWTGRQYQAFIRRGFSKGKNFISVSENTRRDLHRFLPKRPALSEVVYNGLNYPYNRMNQAECKAVLSAAGITIPSEGYLLHVGGNQWYKNREGVLEIYFAYTNLTQNPLPLWMIGSLPTGRMQEIMRCHIDEGEVKFLSGLANEQLCAAYSTARLLIYPSLAEGFGWPIAEAMACECLVLTTNQAPMIEVGGEAACYIPPKYSDGMNDWATNAAGKVLQILNLDPDEITARKNKALTQAGKFETQKTLDAYETIYCQVLAGSESET